MITIDAEKMTPAVNQIVENEGIQYFSVLYNKHKKAYSRAFVGKKLNQLSIVFLRYFCIRRRSFLPGYLLV